MQSSLVFEMNGRTPKLTPFNIFVYYQDNNRFSVYQFYERFNEKNSITRNLTSFETRDILKYLLKNNFELSRREVNNFVRRLEKNYAV